MGRPAQLRFGQHRIGAGWIGIGIAAAVFAIVGGTQVAIGDWRAIAALGPLCLAFAAVCATTRVVVVDPAGGQVRVTRRLLGLAWTRRWPTARFDRVALEWSWYMGKHGRSDGTLEGDQRFMHFQLFLCGRSRIRLEHTSGSVTHAESAATEVATALGLPAERRGYTVRRAGSRKLAEKRKRGREAI